ncbi:MAG: hypothetical protein H0W36_05565 [Gemmatimonadetes bacterium]|nr:hypothetical protein [Gemmatimonadota bacterium]
MSTEPLKPLSMTVMNSQVSVRVRGRAWEWTERSEEPDGGFSASEGGCGHFLGVGDLIFLAGWKHPEGTNVLVDDGNAPPIDLAQNEIMWLACLAASDAVEAVVTQSGDAGEVARLALPLPGRRLMMPSSSRAQSVRDALKGWWSRDSFRIRWQRRGD